MEQMDIFQVSRAAEELLRKKATLDGLSPAVDLESEEFMARVFELLAGSPRATPAGTCRLPVAPPLKIKLYRLCCRSVVSCNMMPRTLEVRHWSIMSHAPHTEHIIECSFSHPPSVSGALADCPLRVCHDYYLFDCKGNRKDAVSLCAVCWLVSCDMMPRTREVRGWSHATQMPHVSFPVRHVAYSPGPSSLMQSKSTHRT